MTAVTEENTIADTLDAVTEVFKRQGWMTGPEGMRVGDGPKCILGAFAQVLGADSQPTRMWGEIYDYEGLGDSASLRYFAATLGIHLSPGRIGGVILVNKVWNWNDEFHRTREDVLQRIEAAAHLARQAHLSVLDEDTGRTEYAAAHLHHQARS